jgi:hypothetical protein
MNVMNGSAAKTRNSKAHHMPIRVPLITGEFWFPSPYNLRPF